MAWRTWGFSVPAVVAEIGDMIEVDPSMLVLRLPAVEAERCTEGIDFW